MIIIDKSIPPLEELKRIQKFVIDEWKKDCHIDSKSIQNEIIRTYNIHSKYLELLLLIKDYYLFLNREYSNIRKIKTSYYRGEMTKEQLAKYSLEQYQGVKPVKTELENLLNMDEDMQEIDFKINTCTNIINMIELIITQIGRRSYDLKTYIDGEKFYAGN